MEAALESQGIDVVIATEIVVYHALQTKKETNWIESNADCCCTSVTTLVENKIYCLVLENILHETINCDILGLNTLTHCHPRLRNPNRHPIRQVH